MRRTLLRLVPVAALAATLMLAGCGLQQSDANVPNAGLPGPTGAATPITAATLTGEKFEWSTTKGHAVVLDFWASWCSPCNAEQPELNSLDAQWAPRGVVFLGVDINDTNANGAAFERAFKVAYPSVNDADEVIASEYNASAPPTVIIIDKNGKIFDRFLGTLSGVSADLTRLTA